MCRVCGALPAAGDRSVRRDTMDVDATVVRLGSHRYVACCLRNIYGIAQIDINRIARLTACHPGADVPAGARGRHRLRDQR